MNIISRELINIANDMNDNSSRVLTIQGNSSYLTIPWEDEKMDAEEIVTYILKTEKKLKKGFSELRQNYLFSCQYYGIHLYRGQLLAYCYINISQILDAFIESVTDGQYGKDQVMDFTYDILNECFGDFTIKINSYSKNRLEAYAKKRLNNK